jgi:signal transduction histidine kinase
MSRDLPELMVDHVQLQQLILNLFLNGIDAMRDNAGRERILAITATGDKAGGMIFSVQDTGPGVPAGAGEKIFDALFSTKRDGLGMGLAIGRTIVENHGGRLWLDTDVKKGARFVFNIPAV